MPFELVIPFRCLVAGRKGTIIGPDDVFEITFRLPMVTASDALESCDPVPLSHMVRTGEGSSLKQRPQSTAISSDTHLVCGYGVGGSCSKCDRIHRREMPCVHHKGSSSCPDLLAFDQTQAFSTPSPMYSLSVTSASTSFSTANFVPLKRRLCCFVSSSMSARTNVTSSRSRVSSVCEQIQGMTNKVGGAVLEKSASLNSRCNFRKRARIGGMVLGTKVPWLGCCGRFLCC